MNYEELYGTLQPQEKSVKDGLALMQRLFKAVIKETEGGDLKGLSRDVSAMQEACVALKEALEDVKDTVESFDARAYFAEGDFAKQMLSVCEEKGVDVRGEFPVYEMFPYKVRLDAENQDVYLDRKKLPCMRPLGLVNTVKAGQEKLNRVSFNAQAFVNELADAYDLAVLKLGRREESDIYLTNLYKFLAPMSRFRKDYDQQSFAFDLARLYASGIETVKDGRRFQFGPSKKQNKAIRILDREGQEQFLATIRFFQDEEKD